MPPSWTIRSLLAWMTQDFGALGLDTPRLDAELLISHVLGMGRVRLYMEFDRPLSAAELAELRALLVRRRRREPVAYIVGQREFYLREFAVSPAVLIPRPDTETLVARALELLPAEQPARVLDLCTGSGAIAVTLAAERPHVQVTATDVSAEALALAQGNAQRHGVLPRMRFLHGDLFEALPRGEHFDLVVANPPYVVAGEIPELAAELQHEPVLALSGGDDGLLVLSRLCAEVADSLEQRGALLFEVGAGQAPQVERLLRAAGRLGDVRSHKDLGGIERVVEAHLHSD
jgi:release factor glutamine methyltransferase